MASVEVGKVYLIEIIDGLDEMNQPGFVDVNQRSPLTSPISDGDNWRLVLATSTAEKLASLYYHICIPLRYNSELGIAVVLLGSSQPNDPHRFIPWHGTQRLPFQTRDILSPYPSEAFQNLSGYVNFSHALQVRVLEPNDSISLGMPGLPILKPDVKDSLEIFMPTEGVTLCKKLHNLYWEGRRYNEDGSIFTEGLIGGPTYGGSGNGPGEGTHENGGTRGSNGRDSPRKSGGGTIGSSGRGVRSLPELVVALLCREEVKAFQLQLVDEEEDEAFLPPTPFTAVFRPLTSVLCRHLESSAV